MKYLFLVLSAVLFLLQPLFGQKVDSIIVSSVENADLQLHEQFDHLSGRSLNQFFSTWENLSKTHSAVHRDSICDHYLQLVYEHFPQHKSKRYFILPKYIRVSVFRSDLDMSDEDKLEWKLRSDDVADSIYYFVPNIRTNHTVLYSFKEAIDLVSSYIPNWRKAKYTLPYLRVQKRLYVHRGHDVPWDFLVPYYFNLRIFNNAVVISVSDSFCTGQVVLIPKDSEELILVDSWLV